MFSRETLIKSTATSLFYILW